MIIDLHSHTLPGMDDGSDSIQTSLKMLQELYKQGADLVCATPHFYRRRETEEEFITRRAAAQAVLGEAIASSGDPGNYPDLRAGAEVAFYSGISDSEYLKALCLDGSDTLLLEMPFREWSGLEVAEAASLALDRGFHVILAHPERYGFCSGNRKALKKLMEIPLGIQVNADTLQSVRSRKEGLTLLTEAKIALLGSDAHNLGPRKPRLSAGRGVIRKRLGEEFLRRMDENAEALTGDRDYGAPAGESEL